MVFLHSLLGQIIFWVGWPFLYFYLGGTRRTRVLVEAGDSILMLRVWHDGNKWAFPGGGVHKNENPSDSAIRELFEETKVSLRPEDLIDLGEDSFKDRGIKLSLARYGCKLAERPNISKQHLEAISLEWVKLAEITENMVDKATWRHLQSWKQQR